MMKEIIGRNRMTKPEIAKALLFDMSCDTCFWKNPFSEICHHDITRPVCEKYFRKGPGEHMKILFGNKNE